MLRKASIFLLIFMAAWIEALPGQVNDQSVERKALVRSLIIPGWGQHFLGEGGSARKFLVTEASLWLMYYYSYSAAQWYQQDYLAYAALHAGINSTREPDDIYYVRVGQYDSISEYNQYQLRQRDRDDLYPTGTDLDWDWDLRANRDRYNELRQASLRATKITTFIIGGMVVNRAISMIDVLFLSRLGEDTSASWKFLPGGGVLRIELNI